jgi:RNA polymerase sigma factor (TIGR02999 family)
VPGDITTLLGEWKAGHLDAGQELVSLTYDELRRLARSYLRRERPGHTLQPTALLNEAYLRLLPHGPRVADSREAFFRLMASEMRRRLVDHARRRLADKRGSGMIAKPLDTSIVAPEADTDVEATLDRLDRAVDALGAQHPRAARVVHLRFLAGLTTEDTAAELGLSTGTVKREWTFAKAWLAAAMDPDRDQVGTDPPGAARGAISS